MALNHGYGCGVAINAPDADIPIRTLRKPRLAPQLGGEAVVVGLGCEKMVPDRIAGGSGCEGCDGGTAFGAGTSGAGGAAVSQTVSQGRR